MCKVQEKQKKKQHRRDNKDEKKELKPSHVDQIRSAVSRVFIGDPFQEKAVNGG
jgi:hypothetical protein